ncbi:MAG: hypothetical protein OXC62_15115 [Aestuariivita sp.]|nr:hypothetical protein [Aestuariivita sp.]
MRKPTKDEQKLVHISYDLARLPSNQETLVFLSSELPKNDHEKSTITKEESNAQIKRAESNNALKKTRVESSDGERNNRNVQKPKHAYRGLWPSQQLVLQKSL